MDFTETLQTIDGGKAHAAATEELERVVEAVAEHGQKGEVTITLAVRREGNHAVLGAKITSKAPHTPVRESLFYFGPGGLVREDPKQLTLNDLEERRVAAVRRAEDSDDV